MFIKQALYPEDQQAAQGVPTTAEQMLEKQFGNSAFDTLRSKFPQLVKYVVTFKVLESDINDGVCLGTFILQSGRNVKYIPVVMADGSIVSCELVYDKEADNFAPLTNESAKDVIDANMLKGPALMGSDANVENTQDLFRNMIRPPASSSVVMAGNGSGVASLPNNAKKCVQNWLNANPEALAKIAAYYDVRELGTKLASLPVPMFSNEPNFYSLKAITKEAASTLNTQEKTVLLRDGFLVKHAADTDVLALPSDRVETEVMAELDLDFHDLLPRCCADPFETRDAQHDHSRLATARVIGTENGKLRAFPCVIAGDNIILENGTCLGHRRGVITQGYSEEVAEEPLHTVGAVSASGLNTALDKLDQGAPITAFLFSPRKNGNFGYVSSLFFAAPKNITVKNINGTAYVSDERFGDTLVFTEDVDFGAVKMGQTMLLPKAALVLVKNSEQKPARVSLLSKVDDLRHFLTSRGRMLMTSSDGLNTQITDTGTKKTASFHNTSDAAGWLAAEYGLSHDQVNTVLSNRATTLFNKMAFVEPQVDPNTGMEMPVSMPQPYAMAPANASGVPAGGAVQPNMPALYQDGGQPVFDPEAIGTAAELGDPDVVDTGILSSFARDPNIKELLVDYLPTFIDTLDKLGRCIILLCLRKKELEDFYGRDKYAQLLGSCRKMMNLLGDTTESLKKYTHMA